MGDGRRIFKRHLPLRRQASVCRGHHDNGRVVAGTNAGERSFGRAAEGDIQRLSFTGSGSEYFGIWIVNILLTIITLGIYSAWAKVRRNRYFYGNTILLGRGFEYHASGGQILIGRLIVFAYLVLYNIMLTFVPLVASVSAS